MISLTKEESQIVYYAKGREYGFVRNNLIDDMKMLLAWGLSEKARKISDKELVRALTNLIRKIKREDGYIYYMPWLAGVGSPISSYYIGIDGEKISYSTSEIRLVEFISVTLCILDNFDCTPDMISMTDNYPSLLTPCYFLTE